jgi:predicted  nucleic acid-binding Zn-ribbon protein
MNQQEIEKEAGKLLKQCRKLKAKIEARESEFKTEMDPIREDYRAKYTRLNQLAKQLKNGIHNL